MSDAQAGLAPVPAHVPPELVRDFDFKVHATISPDTDPIDHVYDVMEREALPLLSAVRLTVRPYCLRMAVDRPSARGAMPQSV